MRCITAICPAGPPKLSSATRIQTRNVSASDMPWLAVGRTPVVAVISVTKEPSSGCRFRSRALLLELQATPCVKGVVHHQSMSKHFVVIREIGRQAIRDREQALALRSEIRP